MPHQFVMRHWVWQQTIPINVALRFLNFGLDKH